MHTFVGEHVYCVGRVETLSSLICHRYTLNAKVKTYNMCNSSKKAWLNSAYNRVPEGAGSIQDRVNAEAICKQKHNI